MNTNETTYAVESININEYAQELVDVARDQGEDPFTIAVTYLRVGKTMLEILQNDA